MSKITAHGPNGHGFPCWTLHVPDEQLATGMEVSIQTSPDGVYIGGTLIEWRDILNSQIQPTLEEACKPKVEIEVYRTGQFWSSSDPSQAVICTYVGTGEITRAEQHDSFIKWMTPYQIAVMTPKKVFDKVIGIKITQLSPAECASWLEDNSPCGDMPLYYREEVMRGRDLRPLVMDQMRHFKLNNIQQNTRRLCVALDEEE